MIHGRVDSDSMLAQGVSNQAKRELSKIEGVHDASQAIILTTMAMKAD